jgi:hypothetical protein
VWEPALLQDSQVLILPNKALHGDCVPLHSAKSSELGVSTWIRGTREETVGNQSSARCASQHTLWDVSALVRKTNVSFARVAKSWTTEVR